MKQTSFKKESMKGLVGEERFLEYTLNRGYYVEDVRKNKWYQKCDIDFIVDNSYYEIKTDYKVSSTGNIVIELFLSRDGGPDAGWWNRSLADWLVVVDGKNNKGYCIDMRGLEAIINENEEVKRVRIRQKDGFSMTESTLALIPLSYLKQMDCMTEIDM